MLYVPLTNYRGRLGVQYQISVNRSYPDTKHAIFRAQAEPTLLREEGGADDLSGFSWLLGLPRAVLTTFSSKTWTRAGRLQTKPLSISLHRTVGTNLPLVATDGGFGRLTYKSQRQFYVFSVDFPIFALSCH